MMPSNRGGCPRGLEGANVLMCASLCACLAPVLPDCSLASCLGLPVALCRHAIIAADMPQHAWLPHARRQMQPAVYAAGTAERNVNLSQVMYAAGTLIGLGTTDMNLQSTILNY